MSKRNVTFTSARAQIRIERILAALAGGPMSTTELSSAVHLDRSAITDYLAHLMKEPRRVRIAEYRTVRGPKNGNRQPVYALGAEPDAPRERMSNVERWERVKADPQAYANSLASRREHHRRARAAVPPELRQRDRRVYDPPLEQQIPELLAQVPGYTTRQLAAKLDANLKSTITALGKLRKAGAVRRAETGTLKEYQWEVPARPLPAPIITKSQGIFAALGV